MFSKLFVFFASVAVLATATPTTVNAPGPATTECCDTVGQATDPAIATILAGIGLNVQDITGLVGVTCSPISVVNVGTSGSCDTNTVSCTNNNVGGLVSLGCVPVTL